jgi:hypothetical protein
MRNKYQFLRHRPRFGTKRFPSVALGANAFPSRRERETQRAPQAVSGHSDGWQVGPVSLTALASSASIIAEGENKCPRMSVDSA